VNALKRNRAALLGFQTTHYFISLLQQRLLYHYLVAIQAHELHGSAVNACPLNFTALDCVCHFFCFSLIHRIRRAVACHYTF